MNKIILASASPRRRELLEQLGVEFEIIPSQVEEKMKSMEPSRMVMELSEIKAEDIYNRLSQEEKELSTVIVADTVVAFEDQVMGKPQSSSEAIEMLSRLQNNTHQVYTGVTLIFRKGPGKVPSKISFFEKTDVTMYPISSDEIAAYVNTGEPMDKAGAYGIQGRGAAFIKEIHGDYNNVVGLPIGRLYQEMKRYQY